jgi:capsular polysaccharide biosynthesis protein
MSVGRGQDNVIFKQRYFQLPHKVRGTVFSLLAGGGGAINYGHWLLDVLPRLHLLRRSGWWEQVDWFLVPSLQYKFQRETLELLGIPLDKCLASDTHRHIQADTLLASTSPRGNGLAYPVWAVSYLRESFLPQAGFAGPPLLYVSRRDSRMRTVRNEAAVEALLQRYGFASEVLSPLTMPEKVALFAGASCIVTPTGAGLNNAVFSQPGAHVLELQSTAFLTPDFADLVQKAGLSYEYLVADDRTPGHNAYRGQRTDLTVNLDHLEQVLHTWQRGGRL